MARIGVSGLTGMIGRNLLDHLRRSHGGPQLVAFTRQAQAPTFLAEAGVPCRRIDFTDAGSFDGQLSDLDAFVHLAGAVRAARPREFFRANRDGTAVLLEALARYGRGVRHFLFASSQTAVGPSGEQPTDELAPCRPVSSYGRSKLAAEEAVRRSGLAWTILRLPAVWGPYDQDGLNILKIARGGVLPVLGGVPSVLSYIFAQDLAPLLPPLVLNERLFGATLNVCYDEPVRLADYLLAVRRLLGLPARLRIVPLPRWTGYLAMAALAVARRVAGGESAANPDKIREFMAARWVQSNARLKAALGLEALSESGALAATVRWFRERGLL